MENKTIKDYIQDIKSDSMNYILALKKGKELNLLEMPVKVSKSITDTSLEKELTIYVNTAVSGSKTGSEKYINQLLGISNVNKNYYSFKKSDDKNHIPIKVSDLGSRKRLIIGYYLKDVNIIYLGYNPFAYNYSWSIFKLYDIIKSLQKQTEVKSVCIKKAQIKILSGTFIKGITNRISDLKKKREDNEKRISDDEIRVMRLLRENADNTLQINLLSNSSVDKQDLFLKELEKLNNLSFMDKWEIDGIDIKLYFSNVYAKYQSKDVYLGNYIVTLKANGTFNWDCENKIKSGPYDNYTSPLIHPHVSGNDSTGQCWGSRGGDVSRAVASGNYSYVATFVNMFLRTYNHGSPLRNIKNWIEYNKENKRVHEEPSWRKK